MILLVGFYEDAVAARTEEFVECLRRNCANPFIDRVIGFVEVAAAVDDVRARWPSLVHPKLELVAHGRRLSYDFLFELANRCFAGAAVAIANADIYFDETLALLDEVNLRGTLLCLSRWDICDDDTARHYDMPFSQDAWIFEPPLPRLSCNFAMGLPGCDNRLAFEAERAGLVVSNPSRSIRANHLHRSKVRRYADADRLHGPTRMLPSSFLTAPAADGDALVAGFPSHRRLRAEREVDGKPHELVNLLSPHLGGVVPHRLRSELRRALVSNAFNRPPPVGVPLATVVIRESMGYSLARMALGISTHNNDARPIASVPQELEGLLFTQVVANHSAPVEVEFVNAGKVYALAAPGWEGYAPAANFLDGAGWREPMELLRTSTGTVFEPWSLFAERGERLVLPTQVMLVSCEISVAQAER